MCCYNLKNISISDTNFPICSSSLDNNSVQKKEDPMLLRVIRTSFHEVFVWYILLVIHC